MIRLQHRQPLKVVSGILRHQLELFEANRQTWCRTQDADALHDLRVAVRRSRAVLGQLKNNLPDAASFRAELVWLGDVSGPLRDLDVFSQELTTLPEGVGAQEKMSRGAVLQFLESERQKAIRQLLSQLDSKRLHGFVVGWAAELHRWGTADASAGAIALGEVCDRQIEKNLRKLLRRGATLSGKSADEEYHRLRIRGKKLRYLLEFFADLYPAGLVPQLVKELKRLQDVLGRFQDCSVWRHWLQRYVAELSPEQYRQLDQRFAAQQQECRNKLAKNFNRFAGSAVCHQLREQLKA